MVGNCLPNVLNALHARHLTPYPRELTRLPWDPYLYSDRFAAQFSHEFLVHLQDDAWRKGKSQVRITDIQESLAIDPCDPSAVKAHIKTEVAPMYPKKARLIQAFHKPVDNYVVADHYRAFTEALLAVTRVPHEYNGIYVHFRSACGLNRVDMAAQMTDWLMEAPLGPNVALFIDDVSNMDASVQHVHLEAQQRLYERLSAQLAEHHAATFSFRGTVPAARIRGATAPVVYSGTGRVKSGAQDTSSGQTARRIDGIVRAFGNIPGVAALRGFAFGDDVWLLVSFRGARPPLDVVAEYQLQYGFKTKGVYCASVPQSQFLSCGLAETPFGIHMFPLVGRQLAKLFWTWRAMTNPRRRTAFVSQIAESALPAYQGFHFVESWLRWHIRPTHGRQCHFEPRPSLVSPPGPVDWQSYVMDRYGLPMPTAQDHHEVQQCAADQVHLLYSPWVTIVMHRDLTDPQEYEQANTIVFDPSGSEVELLLPSACNH